MDKSIVKTVKTLSLSVFPSWGGCMYKSLKTAALSLALTLCIAAPVMAEVPVPTLDRVKSEQTTFLDSAHSSYALTELTDWTAAPEGSITVKIADKTYYYTPSENTEVLKTLASTGSAALVETTKDKATEKLKDSGYSLKEATSADEPNTITLYDKETVKKYYDPKTGKEVAAGDRQPDIEYREVQTIQTTPKYYTVELKQTEYGHAEVKDDTKTFTVTTPDAEGSGKAFEYTVNYYVDDDRLSNDRITTNQNGADIDKDFVGLKNEVTSGSAYGGAIYNSISTIGDITGDFIGNYAFSTGSYARGGAIYNYSNSTIGDITGDFIGNYASSSDSSAYGGAIYNHYNSTIGDITGDFIDNYASSTGSSASGGAIYNSSSTIGNITGDFIDNYASSTGSSAAGGAIYNDFGSTIGDITGDFIGNYATSTSYAYGGAIYNYYSSTIGNITGDFIGNYASSSDSIAYGGAIYNSSSTIGNITGDFIENYATGSRAYGGAIYNSSSTIGDITGDFIENYASGSSAAGGAIYNDGTIGNITGDFIGNYASGSSAAGGAIYNDGTIGNITGDFIGNYAQGSTSAIGGAVMNMGSIMGYNVSGDKMINIEALKLTNPNTGESFVVYNISNDSKQEINAKLEQGYKIVCNQSSYPIPPEQWQAFEEELKAAIEAGEMTTEFPFGDEALAKETGSFINSSFLNNIAEAKNGSAAGGAIFSTNKIHIVADSGQSVFSGNKTISGETEEQNAIGMYGMYLSEEAAAQIGMQAGFIDMTTGATFDKNPASLKLEAKNNGVILFDDTIRGGAIDYAASQNEDRFEFIETPETAFDLTITGDPSGKVILNNDVINANISLDKTNLYLGRENVFDRSQSLTLNSGSIYLNNNTIGTMHIPTLNLNGNTNLSVDADLATKTMDKITADTYNITNNAMLNVNNITLLSDAKEDKTNISFVDKNLANNVAYTGASPIAYSPIYKYQVSYHPETGEFMFLRGATTTPGGDIIPPTNPSDAFNPSVLAPAVATQAGAYTTQLQTFNYAFQHSDNFMNIPYLERVAIIEKNKYALSPTGDATDVGTFSPLLTKEEDAGRLKTARK